MRALAIDIGTGTQDVLLFDDAHEVENNVRLVLPSPTLLVAERIRRATAERRPVAISGRIMGGGPSHWAARDHALAGLPIMVSADAARTFDDDPDAVKAMGIRIATDDSRELDAKDGAVHVRAGDLALDVLAASLGPFGVDLRSVDAGAVAVFDHGAAPPGVSDRRFRFDRLAERLAERPDDGPAAFAYLGDQVPPAFTRLCAAVDDAQRWLGDDRAVLGMDTAPAAVLGSLDDVVGRGALDAGRTVIVANVGNFHTLAMRLVRRDERVGVVGVFEHHTGELSRESLVAFLIALADGSLDGEDVFATMGHGAIVLDTAPARDPLLAVSGPRRALLGSGAVPGMGAPHLAVPHADMMQTGPFGLLRALAHHEPRWREPIERRLGPPATEATT